jgi:tRNA threonylcarbamoyladenosine biosynthesis protein TsaB
MTILTIRTDKPEAEIGIYSGGQQVAYKAWHAHRELAETLHAAIRDLLKGNDMTMKDLDGIVCYKGPGSFTGLRIGLTVANAISYAEDIPIVGETGDDWQGRGNGRIEDGANDKVVMPEYGADVHITTPKK